MENTKAHGFNHIPGINLIPGIKHILLPVFLLVAFGVLMVYSSSSIFSHRIFQDETRYLSRQAVFAVFGFLAMFLGAKIHYSVYRKYYVYLMILTLILLIMTLIPYIGTKIYGARRWLRIGPIGFQPVELLKLTIIFWAADFLERKQDLLFSYSRSFLPSLLVAGIYLALLLLQPDFGNTVLITMTLMLLFTVGGGRMKHIIVTVLFFGAISFSLIISAPYRMRRINAFLDPWADPNDSGYQLINSLISFGSGGLTGRGFGDSLQKQFFLPQAHTDFIFAIIGEELGFIGIVFLMCLYLYIFLIGLKSTVHFKNSFGRNLGFGILFTFILQVIIHMCVVIGLVPTKGIGLPLVSYGGSSMVITMFMLGILYNIGTNSENLNAESVPALRPYKRRKKWKARKF